jgi:uncharacterized protein
MNQQEDKHLQNIHAIIMPTKACNMACTYCYVLHKTAERMPISLAERIVDELLNHNDPTMPTRLIWHGGEPLLRGLSFYRHICEYIREKYSNYIIEHFIQTNGTLLNDEWIDFFLEYNFSVGVSLDGWKELHDACRKTQSGKRTFETIFQNIMRARERGLIVGILSVITRESLDRIDELFAFFYQNKLDFGFHPVTSLTPETDEKLAITWEEFADVSIRMFELGFFQPEPRVTSATPTLHYAMAVMMGSPSGFCVLDRACSREYISIEPNGRVHVCDRFAGNQDLSYGNLAENSLKEILASPVRQVFLNRWDILEAECRDCQWKSVCYGGCPHEAYVKNGTILSRDPNCDAYKRIFTHIAETIFNELRKHELAK